jgi:hypothetical protein
MTREEKIMKRVNLHYNFAIQKYGVENVLGVFLYGSQNYDCDLEDSDVDTKCILVPDLYNLAIKPYETKHLHIPRASGVEFEVCECMTIQHMVANWKKQNPNFLEIMFTEFCHVNPDFEPWWSEFISEHREQIARYDVRVGVFSVAHQAIHTIKQNPMDGKKIGNGYRLMDLVAGYTVGCPYDSCLVPLKDDCEKIRRLKSGEEEVLPHYAQTLIDFFEYQIEYYKQMESEPNRYIEHALNDFILRLIEVRINNK